MMFLLHQSPQHCLQNGCYFSFFELILNALSSLQMQNVGDTADNTIFHYDPQIVILLIGADEFDDVLAVTTA
jgi:hypothetical protein